MHFACTVVAALLLLTVRVKGQCNNTAGCFPAIGNIALHRSVTATSTCGENGTTQFEVFGDGGSGSLMECSADDPLLAYPTSNINDNNLDTSWQSDVNVTDVIVQLDLEGPMLFESLMIVWSTPRPSAMIIERSSDFGGSWIPYRYFATSCVNFFMLNSTVITPDTILPSTEAVCTIMDSSVFPLMDSEVITFNTSSHFYPGITDDEILEYQNVTNLRLNLLRAHADLSTETEIYYGISEWFVYGTCLCNGHADQCVPLTGETGPPNKVFAGCDCQHRTAGNNCEMCEPLYNNAEYMRGTVDNASVCEMCQCFGHADECFYDSTINGGQCICNNNTEGVMCHSCVAGFYRDPTMLLTEPCIDCGCFLPGVSDPLICNSSTGACLCKANVDTNVNTYCDTCLDGFWNISSANPDGCQECTCSSPGSSSQTCNKTSGNCICNDNYLPPFCINITCADGFFLFDSVCTACDCNPVGAVNASCTLPDGQCYCRENITNTRCNAPANGFYARPLDFFIFEAEDANYPDGTNQILPAISNPTNFTGLGFLEITMTITEIVFQFSVSISYRYDLIIRYSTRDEGYSVAAAIQSLSGVNTTLQCSNTTTNDTSDITMEQSIFGILEVTPTHGAEVVHTMCLEARVMYEATFTFFNFGSEMTRLLLDSIVLMPTYTTGSNYLNSPEVLPVHEETAQLCIPSMVGQVNLACDLDLVFILSVEFFGQVYSCGCNPVGTEVTTDCSISSGTCVCKQGIGGMLCDRCIPSYFNFSTNGCTACNCFPPGVVDFTTCDPVNGTCGCKANVDSGVNRICDTCLDGYWNISSDNPDGCQACQCNSNGSSDLVCDKTFGNCSCYANYIGQTCSECANGYYFSNGQCVTCDCHPVGSNYSVCDKTSGQCSCMPNVEGRRCNATQAGFFFRPLDYTRFEAESLSYSEEFTEVFPVTTNPVYENPFTGRGFIAFPDTTGELRFILTVPKSSQYEIILRYRLSEDIIIFMNISSLTPTVNSLDCSEVNDSVNAFESLPLANQNSFRLFRIACLDEGTEYEIIVSHLVFIPDNTIFEVDSIVLIPYFAAVSDFYNSSTIQESQLESCIPRAAGSVPPGNALCDDITFSLSVESFGQVFECDCDVTGTSSIQELGCDGGYCLCKDGIGGERCDRCLNGYYNFSINGCTACECDINNSVSLLCDDGQCSCTLGIAGMQCNECEDGWYNFTSSGCQPCSCERLGSESNVCDKLTGACDCADGAIGDLCDACPIGTILTNTSYQRFCEPCRCYDHSDVCTVDTSTYNLAAITSDFIELCNNSFTIIDNGWTLEGSGTFTRCSTNGLGYNSSITDMDRFVAPANFTGDLTSSYSLQFSVQLQLSQIASLQVDMSMVEICGPEGIECLVGRFELDSSKLQSDSIILLSIPFRETYWQFNNASNSQPTYLEFLYTLTDVTSFSFSASHAMIETYYLQSISLQTIISANYVVRSDVVIIESMFPVEYCQQCFINYIGRFCENCAEGYYRLPGGLDCIACDCNNLSQSCDPLTGICTECGENSAGDNCNSCSTGFYGDPGRNISCLPCDCAEMTDPTCELDVDGNQTCTTCPFGRDGRNCEMCADGYFMVAPEVCFQCNCFGNAIPPDDGGSICDMENGYCINCSFNTTGIQCERCLPGYFGDPTGDSTCSECTCHVNGTDGQCSNIRGVGVCTCKPGTTGRDCDQCLPGYWGLHLGGCRPCECCSNGSMNESCNQTTGECYCLSNVGSENDTRCCECSPGSYNLEPGTGCQECGCSEAVISSQCNENGTCMCTEGAIGEKCDECGFEYSGEIPNCQRCPECFDNGLESINELAANITLLTTRLYQLISTSAPLQENISDIISQLYYQVARAESAVQNILINRSDVTLLENKANDMKALLDILNQNFTTVSDLLISINSSVTDDLAVIAMFDGSVYGTTITDIHNTLENISVTISNLNISSYHSFEALQQRLVEAESFQKDFDSARSNITESLMRINETTQLLSVAENLINSTTMQNLDNKDSLSFLSANISVLQNDTQAQLSRAQRYEAQLNSTYSQAMALWDTLTESEQEILNSSILIEQLYNYSSISLDLTTNAVATLQDLNDNVSILVNKTQELLDNVTIQQDIIFNATGIVRMVNSTTWETLAIRTPNIELAQMLARGINSTFLPTAEVTTIATAIANSSAVAQQTLQIAQNASMLVDQISTLVNDTIEKINTSALLYDDVNFTLQQLLVQQSDIENHASQVNDNLISLNNSTETIANLIETIDMVITNAYAIGIDNYNRSTVLGTNAIELCTLANSIEQQSNELNASLVNISSEVDTAEEDAAAQFTTVQTLHENAIELNATAHQVAVQQLQDLLDEYLADRNRITQLTTTAKSLSRELDQLITDIEKTSVTLRDCIRTP